MINEGSKVRLKDLKEHEIHGDGIVLYKVELRNGKTYINVEHKSGVSSGYVENYELIK